MTDHVSQHPILVRLCGVDHCIDVYEAERIATSIGRQLFELRRRAALAQRNAKTDEERDHAEKLMCVAFPEYAAVQAEGAPEV